MLRFFLREWYGVILIGAIIIALIGTLFWLVFKAQAEEEAQLKKCVAQAEEAYQSISNLCTIEPECHKQLLRLQAESIRNCYRKH